MKKEYVIFIAIALFAGAAALDYFAGPIGLALRQPYAFFTPDIFSLYPLTAVAIGVRTLGVVITILFGFSLIEKNYLPKAIVLLVIGVLTQLYAIQQLATGTRNTSIQWTLSLSYAGILLALPVLYYVLMAIIFAFFHRPKSKPENAQNDASDFLSTE